MYGGGVSGVPAKDWFVQGVYCGTDSAKAAAPSCADRVPLIANRIRSRFMVRTSA
jgi:hypothetical protein